MPSATPIPSDERSPSPPPQAPIPSTPGIRATAFLELYNKTLTNTLTSISYSTFSECFPLIAEQAPGALKAMHESVVSRLGGFAREEFEVILKEREVVRLLNELDERIGEGRKRMARASDGEDVLVPPHTLPPSPLINAHLSPLYRSQQSQLNAKLQTTQSQNANLMKEIRRQRVEIEALLKGVEVLVGDLEGSGGRLGREMDGVGLSGRAREAEGVLGEL